MLKVSSGGVAMSAGHQDNGNGSRYNTVSCVSERSTADLPAAWLTFIRYCQTVSHGEIERLKIQDGVPVLAEVTVKKIRFS